MNEAAERLRGGLEAIRDTSTDSASRQLAESLLSLLEVHDAAERRATVERIRAAVYTWNGLAKNFLNEPANGDMPISRLHTILDEEAAR